MKDFISSALILGLAGSSLASPARNDKGSTLPLRFRGPTEVTANSLHNIHVEFSPDSFEGEVNLFYGDCDLTHIDQCHHQIGKTHVTRDTYPERFIWAPPLDTPHAQCLHAFSGDSLIGRSSPVTVTAPLQKRESIADVADAMGPWFDGVAYMKSKGNNATYTSQAKNSSIAIVGG